MIRDTVCDIKIQQLYVFKHEEKKKSCGSGGGGGGDVTLEE